MWGRIKRKIAFYYTRYLFNKWATIKEIYDKTKWFFDVNKKDNPSVNGRRKENGKRVYYNWNEVYI